jgi:hypothetical protein
MLDFFRLELVVAVDNLGEVEGLTYKFILRGCAENTGAVLRM